MIGQRIAALRKNARLSQAELAQTLGVSPSAVGMYEQGRREPSAAALVALADLFGVTTDYLLTGRPIQPKDAAKQLNIALFDVIMCPSFRAWCQITKSSRRPSCARQSGRSLTPSGWGCNSPGAHHWRGSDPLISMDKGCATLPHRATRTAAGADSSNGGGKDRWRPGKTGIFAADGPGVS